MSGHCSIGKKTSQLSSGSNNVAGVKDRVGIRLLGPRATDGLWLSIAISRGQPTWALDGNLIELPVDRKSWKEIPVPLVEKIGAIGSLVGMNITVLEEVICPSVRIVTQANWDLSFAVTSRPTFFLDMSRREEVAKRDEELLAQLGYKQEFKREFTPLEVFGVAFNVIGLFPSLASVLVYAIPNGGPVAMVWGWAVASVFILCIGLSIAELASAAPTAGVGYVNTVGYISALSECLHWLPKLSRLVRRAAPPTLVLRSGLGLWASNSVRRLELCHSNHCSCERWLGTDLHCYQCTDIWNICCHTSFPCFSMLSSNFGPSKDAKNLHYLSTFVIVGLPIATPKQYMNTARFALGSFDNLYGWPDGFAFVLSLLTPLWTVCAFFLTYYFSMQTSHCEAAFDASVHISEEASNAATAVPWAIVCSNIIATLLGWAINVTLTFCMGTDMGYLLSSPIGQPMAQIFFSSFGQNGTLVLWAFVVIAQYMMGSSCLLVASRQIFAYSRDRALPLSGILCRVNKSASAPVNAVWFAVICAILVGLLAFAGTQAISAIFPLATDALYTAYSITIAARWLGNNNFKRGPFHLGMLPSPSATTMNYTVVVLGGILGVSLVWYYLPIYGGIRWFIGPVPHIGKRDGDSPDFITQDEKMVTVNIHNADTFCQSTGDDLRLSLARARGVRGTRDGLGDRTDNSWHLPRGQRKIKRQP
ncbi:amino acid permease-domain-containing protein [Pisolithus thermaeus]|nr:amino acid permease-domain-containing protein [Pisolithus thermaeus]